MPRFYNFSHPQRHVRHVKNTIKIEKRRNLKSANVYRNWDRGNFYYNKYGLYLTFLKQIGMGGEGLLDHRIEVNLMRLLLIRHCKKVLMKVQCATFETNLFLIEF